MEDLVSVIMCVYNTPDEYLFEAIQSILNQTYKNFELIVLDDGSNKPVNINIFNDSRLKLIRNKQNKGISFSRNLGISKSKGKYIAIMDSDDIAYSTRIEKQVQFMNLHKDVSVCGTWYEQFGEKNNVVRRIIDDNDYYRSCLFFGNSPTILDPSTMIRKSFINLIDFRYDNDLKIGLDYFAWVKFSEVGRVTNLKEVLMKYRVHSNQITKKITNRNIFRKKIIDYQMIKMGIESAEERELISKYLLTSNGTKKPKLNEYRDTLDKLLKYNSSSRFFNQKAFELCVEKQWKKQILETKNILNIASSIFKTKNHRLEILLVFLRHLNPFLKDKTK